VLGLVGVVSLVALAAVACDDKSSSGGGGGAPSAAPSGGNAPAPSGAPSAAGSGNANGNQQAGNAPAPSGSAAGDKGKPDDKDKKVITVTAKSKEAKEAIVKGWELYDNGRAKEALEECKKAVAADGEAPLAHACVGWLTDGAPGQTALDKAAELAAKAPDAEKTWVEALNALKHADVAKYVAGLKKLTDLAPDDYRAHAWAGRALNLKRDFDGAEAEYKKALDLNKEATFAYALLSRAQTQLKKYDEALGSAKKYAEASPKEPAAHQALAAAYLNLDKKKEAEEAATKAVELGPKVLSAHFDLGIIRLINGQYGPAKEAFEKAKEAEREPSDGLDRGVNIAWVNFNEGKDAEGVKELERLEKEADKEKIPYGWTATSARARVFWIQGNPAESLKVAEAGLAKCDSRADAPAVEKTVCRLNFMETKAFDQISLGKGADAVKTADKYKEEAKKVPDVGWVQTMADMLGDAATAVDKKDKKGAAALLAKVLPDDLMWKLSILRLAEKDGDKATVEQVRKDLHGRPLKDVAYPLVEKLANKK
jgi:Flp pilus assembly protein TadD